MRTTLISLSIAALASAAPFSSETIHNGAAPVISSTNAETVPDSYIVVFKKHVNDASAASHKLWVNEAHSFIEVERAELRKRSNFPVTTDIFEGIKHTYNIAGGFLGYSGHFDEDIIEKVRRHPDVRARLFRSLCLPFCLIWCYCHSGLHHDMCEGECHTHAGSTAHKFRQIARLRLASELA